jgi:hypothetical protein
MNSLKKRDFKDTILVITAIIIVTIMLTQIALVTINGPDSNDKTTIDKTVIKNNISPFTNSDNSKVGGINYSLFLVNNSSEKFYNITFTESGLSTGTEWSIVFNILSTLCMEKSSITNEINFTVSNGTYSFTIDAVSGYAASPSSVSVIVNGANVYVNITFVEVEVYDVTFTEIGLSSDTEWSVVLNILNTLCMEKNSTTNEINFTVPNGNYSFTIDPVSCYAAFPSSGNITVNGTNVNLVITFSPTTYTITFTERGLPAGASWSVTLNGVGSSTTTTIMFRVPNGTYTYTINLPSGYKTTNSTGAIKIKGSTISINISVSSTTKPFDYDGIVVATVIVALLTVIAVVLVMRRGKKKVSPQEWQATAKEQKEEKK